MFISNKKRTLIIFLRFNFASLDADTVEIAQGIQSLASGLSFFKNDKALHGHSP